MAASLALYFDRVYFADIAKPRHIQVSYNGIPDNNNRHEGMSNVSRIQQVSATPSSRKRGDLQH